MIGPRGRDLVRQHEGLRLSAYVCPAGKLTIGYGHTSGVVASADCTLEQAERWLEADLREAEAAIDALVRVPLTEAMRDALASWVFNLGSAKLRISTLLRKLNAGDYAAVPTEIKRWTFGRVGGKVVELPGLVRRRADEADLFVADGMPPGRLVV
jgi:lysozyme